MSTSTSTGTTASVLGPVQPAHPDLPFVHGTVPYPQLVSALFFLLHLHTELRINHTPYSAIASMHALGVDSHYHHRTSTTPPLRINTTTVDHHTSTATITTCLLPPAPSTQHQHQLDNDDDPT